MSKLRGGEALAFASAAERDLIVFRLNADPELVAFECKTGFNCSGSATSATGSFFILDDQGVTTANGSQTVNTAAAHTLRPLT
ncbi:MAG: hypothetical protein ACXWJB_15780, partial [Limisphaerales bacterium]